MEMYNASTRLADVIFSDFTVIPLLNRFGINLGVGDETIDSACRSRDINPQFLLDILNITSDRGHQPRKKLEDSDMLLALNYLKNSNDWVCSTALPNIERHFRALHDRSSDKTNNLDFLWSFFQELKNEIISRVNNDSESLFPTISSGERLEGIRKAESSVEEKVDDLASFFVIHLRGDYDKNLCMAVVTSLMALEKEVKRNNRLRERMLYTLLDSYRNEQK